MATLEALGRRITATEQLGSIVRMLKTLSLVGIRHFEAAVEAVSDYRRTTELGLQAALGQARLEPVRPVGGAGVTGAIVVGSDYGLCGRFSETAVDLALRALRDLGIERPDRLTLGVGARAVARLEAAGHPADAALPLPSSMAGLIATVEAILVTLDRWRAARGLERVMIFHNRRTADALAAPHATQLLPVDLERLRGLTRRPWPSRTPPMFTMEADRLLSLLMRQYVFTLLCQAAIESLASEHASRLAAMQAAERNVEERLGELRADYRRLRQESITGELLDVVAGFEAQSAAPGEAER
jgi:F-type H+-transporting ATPase subunit gamma